ncbi:MAG: DEAD/DEAH box helicase [Chromatiaceae bacterium]|nr:DEAD/DEAH box helicase [Chromatiaceae bacterium]
MSEQITDFAALGLPGPLLKVLSEVGYETPSPIQAQAIPLLLAGNDLLGQAQTGTGKTAAFALPLLARIDASANYPQLLVLAPTRELALQVAEALQTYARFLPGFHVLPIYGGQGMGMQLNQLRRGVQVVVGTPGRIMDHMRRGTLDISRLQALVLDEADEMLRMGFIDDVEWILEHTPPKRQIALFSATMPDEIRKVAERHLNEPQHVKIASRTTTAENIRQRYWAIGGLHKLDALTRILENETFDGVIIFVRTKTQTVELAEKLSARGFAAEALNGDVAQAQRERTVDRLRDGKTDILVATDVVARGLDVKRVTHVINYDIPYDTESYVHRIGRTGRAGAAGDAILFVAPRERRMLRSIEKATGQRIDPMDLPSVHDINSKRTERFKASVREAVENEDLSLYYRLVSELEQEADFDALQIAAALARLAQGDVPLLLDPKAESQRPERRGFAADERDQRTERPARAERPERPRVRKVVETGALPLKDYPEVEMERYRVAVGYQHGVKPGNIVGAIANEADLESKYIGHIEIFDDFTTVDLPAGMPAETLRDLQNTWVCQQKLAIQPLKDYDPDKSAAAARPPGAHPATRSGDGPAGRPRFKDRAHGAAARPAQHKDRATFDKADAQSDERPRKRFAKDRQEGPVGHADGKRARPRAEGAKGPRADRPGFKAGGKGGPARPSAGAGKRKAVPAGNKPPKPRLSLKKGPKGER